MSLLYGPVLLVKQLTHFCRGAWERCQAHVRGEHCTAIRVGRWRRRVRRWRRRRQRSLHGWRRRRRWFHLAGSRLLWASLRSGVPLSRPRGNCGSGVSGVGGGGRHVTGGLVALDVANRARGAPRDRIYAVQRLLVEFAHAVRLPGRAAGACEKSGMCLEEQRGSPPVGYEKTGRAPRSRGDLIPGSHPVGYVIHDEEGMDRLDRVHVRERCHESERHVSNRRPWPACRVSRGWQRIRSPYMPARQCNAASQEQRAA